MTCETKSINWEAPAPKLLELFDKEWVIDSDDELGIGELKETVTSQETAASYAYQLAAFALGNVMML